MVMTPTLVGDISRPNLGLSVHSLCLDPASHPCSVIIVMEAPWAYVKFPFNIFDIWSIGICCIACEYYNNDKDHTNHNESSNGSSCDDDDDDVMLYLYQVQVPRR